ncbi:MAG TPA: DOMON-like domain-containing protein [Anaerolineales bacterium]|nr:DOMON-like domain-containing protein [Anaerolineales bacterium]
MTVRYSLSGKIEDILFPEVSSQPGRRDELWLATCFEFFLAIPDQPQYWEFNLSPSGDWNIFRMDSYRRVGFREEKSIDELKFEVRRDADCFSINGSVDIHPIIHSEVQIQAGITTVIQIGDGRESYWALTHPRPQADFHLRKSFILALEGSDRL